MSKDIWLDPSCSKVKETRTKRIERQFHIWVSLVFCSRSSTDNICQWYNVKNIKSYVGFTSPFEHWQIEDELSTFKGYMNSQFFLYVIYSSSSTSTRSRQIHLQGLVLNHLLINFHSRCWHQQTIRDKGDVRMALRSPLVATSKRHKRTAAIIKIDLGFQGRQ